MLTPNDALSTLPIALRADLLCAYERVSTNFAEQRWEPSELNGGKICEAAFCIVEGYLSGTFPPRAQKPSNMVDACNSLASQFPQGPRSARIQIPRIIVALYELRNNRGVGHIGGDVDPNEMDATVVLYMAKWLLSEIIRLIHSITTLEATELVEVLIQRQVPVIWSRADTRRVLRTGLKLKEQVLLLLLHENTCNFDDLVRWIEYGRPSDLKTRIIQPLHRQRMIEFDPETGTIQILSPGITEAESLLKALST